MEKFNTKNLIRKYYKPSDSIEWYSPETDTWFNSLGDYLRNPDEYNPNTEGYTPFGDE